MKKSLSCTELGVAGCSFEACSEKKDEVIDALLSHAGKFHQDMMKNMTTAQKDEMVRKMESKLM